MGVDSPDVVIAKRLLDQLKLCGFQFERIAPGEDGPLTGKQSRGRASGTTGSAWLCRGAGTGERDHRGVTRGGGGVWGGLGGLGGGGVGRVGQGLGVVGGGGCGSGGGGGGGGEGGGRGGGSGGGGGAGG